VNELQAVCEAYAAARARGERAALATVVHVEGSAYRRPGARMIITEHGRTTGTISGGCLERDVLERAAQVIATGAACVVTYDTRGDDDIVWGLGLGCNGVVQILLESLHEGSEGARALEFIAERLRARRAGIIATLVRADNSTLIANERVAEASRVGARLLFDDALRVCAQGFTDESLCACVCEDARALLDASRVAKRVYETGAGASEIFFDVIAPPRALVIFGAERDAVPVVRLAKTLGWHVTVVDTRARPASRERFADADEIVLCRAGELGRHVSLTTNTAAVLMTHNYLDDAALLNVLLAAPLRYLGILGPKQRTAKLLADLRRDGFELTDAQRARLHSPIGVDIGAETPEEIALAIVAEIKAVCAARRGGFLHETDAPIHDERAASLPQVETSAARAVAHESVPLASCCVS
jgi:xanthine dehydrogenase accessory factor